LPVWARIMRAMLSGFPPLGFTADARLAWVDIDPWTGYLADSTTVAENVPFIPGTEPTHYRIDAGYPGYGYDYGYEDLDSLYGGDTAWTAPPWSEPEDSTWDEEPEPPLDTLEIGPQPLPSGPDTGRWVVPPIRRDSRRLPDHLPPRDSLYVPDR
jgi:hypothetical protein